MKKTFITPVIKVINLPKTDIIATSAGAYATGTDMSSGDGEGGNPEIDPFS